MSTLGHIGVACSNQSRGQGARLPAEEALLAGDDGEVAVDYNILAGVHLQHYLLRPTSAQHRCSKQEAPATGLSLFRDSECGLRQRGIDERVNTLKLVFLYCLKTFCNLDVQFGLLNLSYYHDISATFWISQKN